MFAYGPLIRQVFLGFLVAIAACAPHDNLPPGHEYENDAALEDLAALPDSREDGSVDDGGDADPSDVPTDAPVISFDTSPSDAKDATDDDAVAPSCDDPVKPFYCPCEQNSQCASGYCISVDDPEVARRCTRGCVDACEFDWECRSVGGGDPVFLCQPPLRTVCRPCELDSNCETLGALCIDYADGRFCGQDCAGRPNGCPPETICRDVLNDIGQILGTQCVPISGSCQCEVGTDYDTNPEHCGFCTNRCEYFGAVPGCADGECFLLDCLADFVNLNQDDTDGCEYACTYTSDDDWPDAACNGSDCDADCDGLDGTWGRGVFVDSAGRRDGLGTAEDPVPSISAALNLADPDGRDHVYVAAGTYNEALSLREGISIFGGYSNDGLWRRDLARNRTIITSSAGLSSIRVVVADNIRTRRTVLDGVDVLAGNNGNPGGSSYAVWIRNSTDVLELLRVTAIGGNGGAGVNGADGSPGANGVVGQPGSSTNVADCRDCWCNEFSQYGGVGGAAGGNQCSGSPNAAGGRGGNSGCGEGGGDPRPQAGDTSPGGASGGPAPSPKGGGNNGTGGSHGARGGHGDGGVGGGVVSTQGFWSGFSGADGGRGLNGVGGGGGSGGGGADNGIRCASWGGGGGGGGSGGCGGTGGRAGTAGGGSFGVFVHNASPKLVDSTFGHRDGGNGGRGGTGAGGGLGRNGGSGGGRCDGAGTGGAGGAGGDGGRGGNGGGGAGGVAYGLYLSGESDPTCNGLSFESSGAGGLGGAGGDNVSGVPAGNRGADGAYDSRFGSSPRCR